MVKKVQSFAKSMVINKVNNDYNWYYTTESNGVLLTQ
jgi:hypothetical protein